VNADKARAAQFYLDASQEKISLADLTEILLAPDYIFGKTPHRVGALIDMLHKAGILKSKPPSWKDMYFAEAHALPGD
jgi:NitT/TauT family transport system substrate-binding protein